MKKLSFLFGLSLIILLSGCGNKIDITDTDFDVESCDKYFELMECILENDKDETYSEDDRNELRQDIKDQQEEWSGLNEDELDYTCSTELAKFETIKDRLDEIWCSL